jgi:fructan beta-fructosidase
VPFVLVHNAFPKWDQVSHFIADPKRFGIFSVNPDDKMPANNFWLAMLLVAFSLSASAQTYRPVFHFTPPKNWTNDPNGLVYYDGRYHIFYQYNPFGDKWGHMSWGHATSKDMMRWNHEKLAIPEFKNGNGTTTMIFSGTAVNDKKNTSGFGPKKNSAPLVAVYTAHIDSSGKGIKQYQNIAYSNDGKKFTEYEKNPVLDIGLENFRDPKIFWHKPTLNWVMIIAKPLEFSLQLYASPDLKEWKFLSEFSDSKSDKSKIWECPDIFELPVENENGVKKWVITLSGGHPQQNDFVAMQYFIGEFDGKTFKADRLSYPLYMDHGKDFYAGIIFNDMPASDKRKIMIAWVNSWQYANDIPTKGFRGQMSVPRELSVYKDQEGEYRLRSFPVREVNKYRGTTLYSKNALVVKGDHPLPSVKGDALDIEFTITRGSAAQAGIRVLKSGNQQTLIYYDKNDNSLKVDRTNSGEKSFSEKFPSIESVPLPAGDEDVPVRILIDKCIIEVFANKGKQVMTDLVFPVEQNTTAEFYTDGSAAQFRDIKIRRMKASM